MSVYVTLECQACEEIVKQEGSGAVVLIYADEGAYIFSHDVGLHEQARLLKAWLIQLTEQYPESFLVILEEMGG